MSSPQGKAFIVTDYARNLIAYKARQLSRRRDCWACDREDLQQKLWCHLCEQADRYDPAKSSLNTFINRVIASAAAMIVRDQQRKKRHFDRAVHSLEAESGARCSNPDSMTRGVSAADLARLRGLVATDAIASADRVEAVAVALARMPDELRVIAHALMYGRRSHVVRDNGLTWYELERVCREIQAYLEEAGLGKKRE